MVLQLLYKLFKKQDQTSTRCDISYVFQDFPVFPDFTVFPDLPDFWMFLDFLVFPDFTVFLDLLVFPDFWAFLDFPVFQNFQDFPVFPDFLLHQKRAWLKCTMSSGSVKCVGVFGSEQGPRLMILLIVTVYPSLKAGSRL